MISHTDHPIRHWDRTCPACNEALRQALAQGEPIKPSDLLIDTYSVNLGAWSVNNRGVKITHVPTGTVVCSDSERSQHANKRVAMQKLEAALAQPEQEPVAWMTYKGYLYHASDPKVLEHSDPTPLYTAPPSKPWVSLSDEEIKQVYRTTIEHVTVSEAVMCRAIARAIEAALRSKNEKA